MYKKHFNAQLINLLKKFMVANQNVYGVTVNLEESLDPRKQGKLELDITFNTRKKDITNKYVINLDRKQKNEE
jgi:hypothetical protein